ncbi:MULTISPECIES: hypothetical protein [unclassified Pseudoxanthomonas]|uniref:hypothetical protein n=1 Tax=unclassified Pseudoxanthomonas TaxID=2645906 RepID=UPI00307888A6
MFRRLIAAALLTALPLPALAQDTDPAWDPAQVDLSALISCQGQPEQFMALAIAIQDPLKAVSLGWRPLPQTNMFMTEYALNAPVTVFGHSSQHIAFAGSSVMAILDMPDPRPLARQLGLEAAVDTPEKAMFGKEVLSEETADKASGKVLVRSAVLSVSNVTSHPGKTLAGCTYSIDPAEEDPEAPAAERATRAE